MDSCEGDISVILIQITGILQLILQIIQTIYYYSRKRKKGSLISSRSL